ncbi:MAG: hypothetical protein HC836_44975 [Richelia sp. RM2_1_2]|nr:hypothetical protein [Richelia sp. RM2_1_2]
MAANTVPIFTDSSRWSLTEFVAADTTALKTLFTAGADGSLITAIIVATQETVANDIIFYANLGGAIDAPIGYLEVPIGAGTNGTTQVASALTDSVLTWPAHDNNDNPVIQLPSNFVLKANMRTTVGGSDKVFVTVVAEDF